MKIRDLDFGNFVFGQSGVQAFFGEPNEHKIHKVFRILFGRRFSFSNMIFVAKSVTLLKRVFPESSNTELYDGYKLKKWFPKSIWFSFRSYLWAYMLNAMGIPNPGLRTMLLFGKWQKRKDTFQISIALEGETAEEKRIEAEEICNLLIKYLPLDKHKYALQLNDSCPNLGKNHQQNAFNLMKALKVFKRRIPGLVVILKFDLIVDPRTIVELKPYCDAFCVGNSLGFGKLKSKEWWNKLFPKGKSPLLKHFGGRFAGGLSGAPLFPILVEWLERMERIDNSVIIIAGGGIMKKKNILQLSQFKIVHGIALGAVASLRSRRLQPLIRYGNKVFRERVN